MALAQFRRAAALGALLGMLGFAGVAAAEATGDYKEAQFVQVALGAFNQEAGIRLVDGQPDGLTEPLTDGAGRRSLPNTSQPGAERFFYLDVHDSYIYGGINRVTVMVTYLDKGLTPVFLEYDSYDPMRPGSNAEAVVRKRIPLVSRTNTEGWKTESVSLEDARFAGGQPGLADFRIGSADELVLRNVSLLRVAHEEPPPPIRVMLDGRAVTFDVVPWVDPITNRTLVPMRALFNALGVPNEQIKWDGAARKVEARRNQTLIALSIDSEWAQVNYLPVKLDQPAVIKADRTLVPLRFVAEQFGLSVEWNGAQRLIALTSPARPPQPN